VPESGRIVLGMLADDNEAEHVTTRQG